VADRRGGRFLRDVADVYSKLYFVLDGNQGIVAPAQTAWLGAPMVIRQQNTTLGEQAPEPVTQKE
jgi:hypothetical protein